jgi:virginiamycin B lyase
MLSNRQPRLGTIFPLSIVGLGILGAYNMRLPTFQIVIGLSICLSLATVVPRVFSSNVGMGRIARKVMAALAVVFLITLLFPPSIRAAAITEYNLPPGSTQPYGVTFDAASTPYNVWIAEFGSDKIGRMKQDTSYTQILEFQLRTGSRPWDIEYELDSSRHRVWFTESSRDRIGVISNPPVGDGHFNLTEYVISSGASPRGIAVNSTGNNKPYIWFTEYERHAIGLLILNYTGLDRTTERLHNPAGDDPIVTEWYLPDGNARPLDILFLPGSGGVWFTEFMGDRIGFFSFRGNITKEWPLPSGSYPFRLSNDTFGNIWFTMSGRNRIGRLNPYTNEITEYLIPTPNAQPYGIWVDSHNNVWFTEHGANKVGKFTPGVNTFVEFSRPGGSAWDVRVAPNEEVWFSDDAGSRVGRLNPNIATTSLTVSTVSTVAPTTTTATTLGTSRMASTSSTVKGTVGTVQGNTTQRYVSTYPGPTSTNASLATTTSTTSYSASETSYITRTSSMHIVTSAVVQPGVTTLTSTSYVSTVTTTTSVTATQTQTLSETVSATTTSTYFSYTATTTSTETVTFTTTVTKTSFTISLGADIGAAKVTTGLNGSVFVSGLVAAGLFRQPVSRACSVLRKNSKKVRWKTLGMALLLVGLASMMVLPSKGAAFTEWNLQFGSAAPYGLMFDDQSPAQLWFAEFGSDRIGRLNPGTSEIREIALQPNSRPWGLAFESARKEIWFSESGRNIIGRITGYGSGSVSEFQLDVIFGAPFYSEGPRGLAVQEHVNGTDKPYIWFTEYGANAISKLDPYGDEPKVTRWFLPTDGSGPQSIVFSKEIGVWFTEYSAGRLGNLNPSTGTIREWQVASDSRPWDLAIDSGNNIWYTDPGRNKISRFNPYNGEVIEYLVPSAGAQPYGIVIDSRGWIWFAEHGLNRIGRFVPDDCTFTEYPRATGVSVWDVVLAPGSNIVWFGDDSANRLGRFDHSIAITYQTTEQISTASTSRNTLNPIKVEMNPGRAMATTKYSDASTTVTFATTTSTISYQVTETAKVLATTSTSTSTSYTSETMVVLGTSTSYYQSTIATVTSTTTLTSTSTRTIGTTTSAASTSTVQGTTTQTATVTITTGFGGIGIPGFPIESIIAGICLAAVFLIALSKHRRVNR